MKKCLLLSFALSIISFISISCQKNSSLPVTETEIPAPVETFINGKVLAPKANLCLFGRDSKMHKVLKLYPGEDVFILETDGKTESMSISDEETNLEYVHVVHDNMDFWLEKSVFALNCENAVAIEKTPLYTDFDLSQKIEGKYNLLKFADKIAVIPDENSKSTKIFYYDSTTKSVQEAFVLSSSISTKKDDIIVSGIVEELKVTKRAVPRNELFSKASKYKPSPKVLAALNAQKTETQTNSYQEVLKSMQRMSRGVNVEELLTVDQSKDPFK